MKNVCVLVPTTNQTGKRDVTHAFVPEARRFATLMRGKSALRSHADFRFRCPSMTISDIHTELLQPT